MLDQLDETARLSAGAHPALSTDDTWADSLTLGVDEGSIRVNALAVALEVVKTRERTLAHVVRALVGFGALWVVGGNVRLQVESTSETTSTDLALVTLLGVVGGLAGDIASSTTVGVGDWRCKRHWRPVELVIVDLLLAFREGRGGVDGEVGAGERNT